ncbi:MAG TPA: FGGY family carbohydrate kinase [Candidatus Limnocylindrales bacterium]|nr:FGGY family carbohydrate kinase [Candidatus Limnocylindrales bacterium]
MSHFVMAIDAGTTGVRAVVFDRAGHSVASSYRELRAHYPRPQWVEQDPLELWESTRTVMGEAMTRARAVPTDIAAIGITNQRSSVVAWDGPSGRPLSPLLVWQDTRTGERCAELQALGFFITPMMAASKAEWILRNVPEAASAAARGHLRLGMPNSFLVACLCGDINVSDHGNASPTGMYSYFHNVWDRAPLAALGLEESWLPRLVDSSGEIGRTKDGVFGASVPVAGMAGDQQASLFGLACVEVGQTKCSYGTSAMITVNSGESVALGGPGTYPVVAWCYDSRTFFSLEGQVVTSGAAIQWLRDGLGLVANASETSDLAFSVPDSAGVWAVPAFQGLGTPVMRAEAKAMIGGLSRGTTRAHIVRAMLEGIAHRVADVADSLHEGVPAADTVRADGGASRNDFLLQCQADLLGVRVERSLVSDGAALGAARLAGIGVGFWPREEAAHWETERAFEPRISADERAERRETWKKRVELVLSAID